MSRPIRRSLAMSVMVMWLMLTPLQSMLAAPIPAVATSVVKAIVQYFGKEGTQEATEYLSKKGGQELIERVSSNAAKQGGDEAVEQVATMAGKYGPDALAALDNVPDVSPILAALRDLPESQAKVALARLSAGANGRELAEAVGKLGTKVLQSELKHPGVGMILVRSLGDDGAELATKLNTDQAIAVARHAEDLAKLSQSQRQGVMTLLRNDTERMLAFVGRFVEANPGKTLFTVATTTVILAEPERILGGDEVVMDAAGNPVVVRKGGIADRTMEAGGAVAEHVSERYVRPVFLTVCAFLGTFATLWLAFKIWQIKKLKSSLQPRVTQKD